MKFEQIRNATIILEYDNKKFLIDPWLAPKGTMGTFKDSGMTKETIDPKHNEIAMPICDLPKSINEILNNIDYYILTHIHPDHIDIMPDGTVGKYLNHNTPIFTQSKNDSDILKKSSFSNVYIMNENTIIDNSIQLIKTPGLHGTKIPICSSSGFILKSSIEKTVYVAGDTIYFEGVEKTLKKYNPDVIILNTCGATFNTFGRLIMDDKDIFNVYKICPNSIIIASHMDNVAHATLNRMTLKEKLTTYGIANKILIPNDGESYII